MKNEFYYQPMVVANDNRLEFGARNLYSEILTETMFNGTCSSTNRYFAEKHDVSISTIKRWIKGLQDCGYIEVEYKLRETNQSIEKRFLHPQILIAPECLK